MARANRGGDGSKKGGNGSKKTEERDEPKGESRGVLARVASAFLGAGEQDDEGMKATDLLKQDHKRVKDLFSQYEEIEGAGARKKEIVDQIRRELEIHAQLEEKIFYQSFKGRREEEPKKIVRESFEEHKIVKTLLMELGRLGPQDEQYDAKVTVLKESVEHHVREEEGELFPAAEKQFSNEELERLGAEMEDLKEELEGSFEGGAAPSGGRPRRSGQKERPAEA